MVELRVGEAKKYFKRSFNDSDFKCTDFMMKKYMVVVNEKISRDLQPSTSVPV